MIIPNPIVVVTAADDKPVLEREETSVRVHPSDAEKEGFFVSPQAAKIVVRALRRSGITLVDNVAEVFP